MDLTGIMEDARTIAGAATREIKPVIRLRRLVSSFMGWPLGMGLGVVFENIVQNRRRDLRHWYAGNARQLG
jgi:hypothetical protein